MSSQTNVAFLYRHIKDSQSFEDSTGVKCVKLLSGIDSETNISVNIKESFIKDSETKNLIIKVSIERGEITGIYTGDLDSSNLKNNYYHLVQVGIIDGILYIFDTYNITQIILNIDIGSMFDDSLNILLSQDTSLNSSNENLYIVPFYKQLSDRIYIIGNDIEENTIKKFKIFPKASLLVYDKNTLQDNTIIPVYIKIENSIITEITPEKPTSLAGYIEIK